MMGDADVAAAAALLAEPARAALVVAIISEGSLPASELAARARIASSTASEHLARLVDGGFLVATRRGRHRYYELADPGVAEAVEALAVIAPQRPVRSLKEATTSELIREARTCYDHLAGRLGVAVALGLERRGMIVRRDGTYVTGPSAERGFAALGVDLEALARVRRPLIRGCLDWSERELHVAGALGAALTARLFELGAIKRRDGSRAVAITDSPAAGHESIGLGRGRSGRRSWSTTIEGRHLGRCRRCGTKPRAEEPCERRQDDPRQRRDHQHADQERAEHKRPTRHLRAE
jgi:DNA-binding transcriptional ArsR family regulator